GNVGNRRPEPTDIQRLAGDRRAVVAGHREGRAVRIGDRVTQVREGGADGELGRRAGEHITGVKRGRGAGRNRQRHVVGIAGEARRGTSVGGDEAVPCGGGGEGGPRSP